jgi:hypothetical protein
MMRLVLPIALVALLATAHAAPASESLPRYKLKPGTTLQQTLMKVDRSLNRAPGFSGADC